MYACTYTYPYIHLSSESWPESCNIDMLASIYVVGFSIWWSLFLKAENVKTKHEKRIVAPTKDALEEIYALDNGLMINTIL